MIGIKAAVSRGIAAFRGPSARQWSTRDARAKVQPASLLHYGSNVYSERGDDGIVREVFRRLKVTHGFFIEFGAWDGIYLSNTRLLYEQGWSGLYIESDSRKVAKLKQNYAASPDVRCINGFVYSTAHDGGKTLDHFCDENDIGEHLDFLSIDIDGLDLNIFESLRRRATLICIEGGFAWHPEMTVRVPDEVAAQNLQQPLAVAVNAVLEKGYEPICFNQNLYAVERQFAGEFEAAHDAVTLWLDAFFDQSLQFRSHLLDSRQKNSLIQQYEGPLRSGFGLRLTA